MSKETASAALCACGCGKLPPIARETRPKRGWVKGERLKYYPHHSKNRWPLSDGVTKQCRRCNKFKPVSEFWGNKENRDGMQHSCKPCAKARVYSYRTTTQGHIRTAVARRKSHLSKFRLTEQDYEDMLFKQDGRCALCRRPETLRMRGKLRRLAVDHCHKSGKVRGLLCCDCNQGIGKLRDDPKLLRKAADYIESA